MAEPNASTEQTPAQVVMALIEGGTTQLSEIVKESGFHDRKARRALTKLRESGCIRFRKAARGGHWECK